MVLKSILISIIRIILSILIRLLLSKQKHCITSLLSMIKGIIISMIGIISIITKHNKYRRLSTVSAQA